MTRTARKARWAVPRPTISEAKNHRHGDQQSVPTPRSRQSMSAATADGAGAGPGAGAGSSAPTHTVIPRGLVDSHGRLLPAALLSAARRGTH